MLDNYFNNRDNQQTKHINRMNFIQVKTFKEKYFSLLRINQKNRDFHFNSKNHFLIQKSGNVTLNPKYHFMNKKINLKQMKDHFTKKINSIEVSSLQVKKQITC